MGDISLYFYATTESQNIPEGTHKDHKVQRSAPQFQMKFLFVKWNYTNINVSLPVKIY